MNFERGRPVHFVGIGGAGMSAIAKVLLEQDWPVSGSDLKSSRATAMLEAMGAIIRIGHGPDAVPENAVVVVSSAIPDSNPEVVRARSLGHRLIRRGEALAAILENHRSVVVAGTHGKTTTTSMIVTILSTAGFDPTYLVGGELNDSGTNAHYGRDDIAVAESDESDGSFLLLSPTLAVVTNMEPDHLDYWGTFEAIQEGFEHFISKIAPDGKVIVPTMNPRLLEMARSSGREVITFNDGGDVVAADVRATDFGSSFVIRSGDDSAAVALSVPGRYNIANALAAASAAVGLGVELSLVARGLESYRGVKRRFQVRGKAGGVTVIDDYAHHPSEVRALLAAARLGPWGRVVAVFQPHRYSRTSAFWRDFGDAFLDADRIVVTDVYGAGEQPVPGVTGKLIADAVGETLHGRSLAYLPHRSELLAYLAGSVRPGDAVFTLGAGDVTSVGEELLTRLGSVS